MKYGTAVRPEPHVCASSVHSPDSSVSIVSTISSDQPSPVRHWKSSSAAEPIETKLRSSLMPSRWAESYARNVKSCTPRME